MTFRRSLLLFALSGSFLVACEETPLADPVYPLHLGSADESAELGALAASIGDSRIVLLGENGHGVGSLTAAKVDLVRWLHREMGFEVLAFESGFFECGNAWRSIGTLGARQALYGCLKYPFQHAEMLPLFEDIVAQSGTDVPLELAGMDLQAQGYDSAPRLAFALDALAHHPELARQIAALDTALYLVEAEGGLGGDAVHAWAAENENYAREQYAEAAAQSDGWERWVFEMSAGLVERLALRGRAEAAGTDPPARYYSLRDAWMAHATSALADSIAGQRKVIVWLHNDHARYGDAGYAGAFLRDQYGADVYALGIFMGEGQIADNGRTVRDTEPYPMDGIEAYLKRDAPASYLILRDASDPDARAWASQNRPYLRMGIDPRDLVPADEFDALLYVDRATVPTYDIP